MIVLGIDPGLEGAVAVISTAGAAATPTPTIKAAKGRPAYDLPAMLALLTGSCAEIAFLERLQPLPPKLGGSAANYQRGRALALWEMALTASSIPYQLVSPAVWQRWALQGTPGTDTGQRSILAAQRLFPGVSLRRTERSRVPSDGMADALLIAAWGRWRAVGGESPREAAGRTS